MHIHSLIFHIRDFIMGVPFYMYPVEGYFCTFLFLESLRVVIKSFELEREIYSLVT